ncbi:hypothetical protein FNV43_RR00357 [Rhamnella rubrinervis]|uniref:Uncharacterized protein n=1 Tax=Rhamnella rubrinervis TaxID=2594499 RepID=A0A8K0HQ77_9ROSA|nr:hypothetical protein FNV43_RR00357 [Rhamnella rubrinervis]
MLGLGKISQFELGIPASSILSILQEVLSSLRIRGNTKATLATLLRILVDVDWRVSFPKNYYWKLRHMYRGWLEYENCPDFCTSSAQIGHPVGSDYSKAGTSWPSLENGKDDSKAPTQIQSPSLLLHGYKSWQSGSRRKSSPPTLTRLNVSDTVFLLRMLLPDSLWIREGAFKFENIKGTGAGICLRFR